MNDHIIENALHKSQRTDANKDANNTKNKDNRMTADCHYVPQSVFTEGVEFVSCSMEELKAHLNLTDQLSQLKNLHPHNHSHLTTKAKLVLRTIYKADFQYCRFGEQD